jgi:Surface lipoprotein assembly modifier/Tetratricopeptide repeat
MQLVQAGNYELAIRTLRALLAQTQSPRVKLELARALFLNKQYSEARVLFNDVLADPDTPWRVRENIEGFARQIDNLVGFLRFSISVVHDSNPLNITSQREFTIGGFRLTYQPPPDNKPVTGLRYVVQALQPIYPAAQLAGYVTASYLDYPGVAVDRANIDAGLSKGLGPRAVLKGGIEAGSFSNRWLYAFPYASAEYAFVQTPREQLAGGVKLGYVRFPDYSYLNAGYGSVALSGLRAISEAALLSARLTLEHSDAYQHAYSYNGIAFAPGASYLLSAAPILLSGSVGLARRDYSAADPFFGIVRIERKSTVELRLQHKEWRWRNAKAALVFSVEDNRSNIDFYSYRKVNASIAVE